MAVNSSLFVSGY